MAFLIQLRQRIKAIDTIKKITHAMRLISMSSRSKLKSKEDTLREYSKVSTQLLGQIKAHVPGWHNPLIQPAADAPQNPLVILIGSQRGLCGNFNTTLFHFFEKEVFKPHPAGGKVNLIAVGKKAIQYSAGNPNYTILAEFTELNAKTLGTIANQIVTLLAHQPEKFTHVSVFSNQLKTFFIQKPHETLLIPFNSPPPPSPAQAIDYIEYYWEQSPQELLDQLAYQTLEVNLHHLLFQSLLAEHAARFISMDNATRNAHTLLEETQLQYNK